MKKVLLSMVLPLWAPPSLSAQAVAPLVGQIVTPIDAVGT
jgi:hypothetical protein